MVQLLISEMHRKLTSYGINDILENHGHLEHQIGKVAMRNFLSGLEVLLCTAITIRIANNPAHLRITYGFMP